MTTELEQQAATKRTSSWRDKVSAQYEIDQARLRLELEEEPEEHL